MRRWIMAVVLAAVPSQCFASYDIICNGKRGTPEVDVKVGGSEMVVYRVIIDGRGEFSRPAIRQGNTPRNRLVLDLLERGRSVATVRLVDTDAPLGWVGTMRFEKRKYQLTCGDMG